MTPKTGDSRAPSAARRAVPDGRSNRSRDGRPRLARGRLHRLGIGLLLAFPLLDGPAGRQVAVDEVVGGGGEGQSSLDVLWWPPYKVSGRFLTPWLYHADEDAIHAEPSEGAVDVEVTFPSEWHEEPMALDPFRARAG